MTRWPQSARRQRDGGVLRRDRRDVTELMNYKAAVVVGNGLRRRVKGAAVSVPLEDAHHSALRRGSKNPGPGMSDHEAECVLNEVDKQFEEMCKKGMADPDKFKLRPPGLRGKGLPGSGGGGGTATTF